VDEFPTCNELDVWGNFVLCMDKAVDSMDYVPFFIRRNGIILDMWREHLQEMRKGNLSVFEWWHDKVPTVFASAGADTKSLCRLRTIALYVFSLAPTSVEAERDFSAMSNVEGRRRQSMNPETINKLHFASRSIKNLNGSRGDMLRKSQRKEKKVSMLWHNIPNEIFNAIEQDYWIPNNEKQCDGSRGMLAHLTLHENTVPPHVTPGSVIAGPIGFVSRLGKDDPFTIVDNVLLVLDDELQPDYFGDVCDSSKNPDDFDEEEDGNIGSGGRGGGGGNAESSALESQDLDNIKNVLKPIGYLSTEKLGDDFFSDSNFHRSQGRDFRGYNLCWWNGDNWMAGAIIKYTHSKPLSASSNFLVQTINSSTGGKEQVKLRLECDSYDKDWAINTICGVCQESTHGEADSISCQNLSCCAGWWCSKCAPNYTRDTAVEWYCPEHSK